MKSAPIQGNSKSNIPVLIPSKKPTTPKVKSGSKSISPTQAKNTSIPIAKKNHSKNGLTNQTNDTLKSSKIKAHTILVIQ